VFGILHVCMGNICRSPMAERLTLRAARDLVGDSADSLLLVHGAGTGGWHVGSGMDVAAARQVRARGGDPERFAARQLASDLIEASDLILTATGEQWEFAREMRPDAAARTFVLGEFGRLLPWVALVEAVAKVRGDRPPLPQDDLDDPWGRGDGYFSRVADEIEETVRPLTRALLCP
jgi:protein-tyrosine phosphatase